MGKPRYPWWGYAINMARQYPALCRELSAPPTVRVTTAYGDAPVSGSGVHRAVEAALLSGLDPDRQREHDAVRAALEDMARKPGSGAIRLRLIELVYLRCTHRLYGAAQEVGISETTAKRYSGDFLRSVARHRGLLSL